MEPNPINPLGQNAIPVQSETLRQLMFEGGREFRTVEPWFYLMLILMGFDVCLGLLHAYRRHDIASDSLFDGLKKKVTMILVVGAMIMIDPFIPGLTISVIAASAYVMMEILSIIEKAGKLGAPLPEGLIRVLRAMRSPEETKVRIMGSNDPIPTEIQNLPLIVNDQGPDPAGTKPKAKRKPRAPKKPVE